MALSRPSVLGLCAAIGGTAAAAALAMSPAAADGGPVASPAGGCGAIARVEAQWGSGPNGGQILAVTVTNTSAATTTKWAVSWALGAGRRIVSAWNAAVSTSGDTATAINASHNGILAPGTSATFGTQLSGVGPAPALSCDNGATTPTSSAPPSGPAGQTVTVSAADNRSTVRLRVGDALVVSLASNYLPPALSTVGVLVARDSAGGYPTGQPLVARYLAAAAGTVEVSTLTDIACNHQPTPCPSPQVPWAVTVTVTD
ncbi:cellulose binding domain-containing protein [Actinoplanes sp. NPDC049668]|uniref:cellulose binding domain-containing protein n=1 Tax=unclassified Actinoplanes TaxID=2626549 RepID=UPI0033AC5368